MTAENEFGTERQQIRHFKDSTIGSAFSRNTNQLAVIGDHFAKIIESENIQETITVISLEAERGLLDKVCWSTDGQYLTVSSKR